MSPFTEDLLDAQHPSLFHGEDTQDTPTSKQHTVLLPSQVINSKNSSHLRNYNLRHNFPYGDSEEVKPPDTIRIWLQNPNGINIHGDMDEYLEKLEMMKRLQIDIWAAPEHNIDWTGHNEEKLRKATSKSLGHSKVVGVSSDEGCLHTFKPGGAMIVARGNVIGRINKYGGDTSGLGRWCYICFNRYGTTKWWVICGYRVSQTRTTGINTAYNQQERILRRKGVEKPNPRKQWDQDMLQFLSTIDDDDQVLLLADSNAGLEDIRFGEFVSKSRLFDLIGGKHGVDTPPTFLAGKFAIDLALGSEGLVEKIVNCGYTPFHKHMYTDHRAGFLDLSTHYLFKGIPPTLYSRPTRQFSLKYKKKVHAFLEKASGNIIDENIQHRVQQIEKELDVVDKETSFQAIDYVHKVFHNALMQAADSLPVTPTTWWTVEIHQANQLVQYWSAAISFRRNNMVGDEILGHLRNQMDNKIDIYQGDANRSDYAQLRLACKKRREARKDSYEKRQKELENRIVEFCKDEDPTKQEAKKLKILKAIKSAEARNRMYKIFRRYLRPSNQSTLGHIDVPDYHKLRLLYICALKAWTSNPTDLRLVVPWVSLWTIPFSNVATFLNKTMPHFRVVEKEELNDQLYQFHVSHFRQAHGSPFTIEPLSTFFGEYLETEEAANFFNGDDSVCHLPGLSDDTKTILRKMIPTPVDPPEIDVKFDANKVKGGFKIWSERTSTSPLGNHLGFYKAWLLKEKPTKALTTEAFCDLLARFFNIAIRLERPYSRWAPVHNIYLQKDPGVFRINRMRMIHIIDAELNLFRREVVTRSLMANAEDNAYLTDTQYGGRRGRAAIDVPVLRTFMYEVFHQTRANIAITDCDAKACYDRIVAIVTAIVEIKAGLPLGIAKILIKALKQMRYHMMTAYGASERTNQHNKDEPLHGIGQGPTDAPSGNTFNSDIVAKTYEETVQGCELQDPMGHIIALIKLLTFVDDSGLTHGGDRFDTSPQELMELVHKEINTWDAYLQVIGQLLEILKSSYSMLVWNFEEDGTPYILSNEDLPKNTVTLERQGIISSLTRNDAKEAPRMLGVHKALTLEENTEVKKLQKKNARYRKAVIACPCKPHEVWISYRTIYISSISYSFPAITLTNAECEELHKKLLPSLLPRLGYHHGFPRAVAFASEDFYGIGLFHLKALHFALQVEHLIKHIRADTTVGTAALIMIRWCQHCSGIEQPILATHQHLPHLEGKWINNLRAGLLHINGTLVVTKAWSRPPQRENDRHLMSVLLSSEQLDDHTLLLINYCRYIMQVEHISDITTSDGKRIHPDFLSATTPLSHRTQDIIWPQQASPSRTTWKLWSRSIKKVICNDSGSLKTPLGQWTQIYKKWGAYYDKRVNAVFTNKDGYWRVHPVQFSNRRILEVYTRGESCGAPLRVHQLAPVTDLRPVPDRPFSRCTIPSAVKRGPKPTPVATFHEFIQQLPEWERVLLTSIEKMSTDAISLKTHLALATELWFVTDGGENRGLGYYGWIIATDCHILWQGWGHAEGHPDLMESLRAESSGLLALLLFLLRYIEYHELSLPNDIATHYCDNKTLVNRMKQMLDEYPLSPTQWLHADRDVHAQIEATIEDLGIQLPSLHVKGHQDDKPGTRLTWQAQLNIRCDALASKARQELQSTSAKDRFSLLPAGQIYLVINNKGITKSIRSSIQNAWTSQDLRAHLMKKFNWNASVCDEIDWYPGGRILRAKTYYQKRFIIRYTHERLPFHGESFTNAADPSCPYCAATETAQHFLICPHNPENWQDLTTFLSPIWNSLGVDPVLRILIIMGLTSGQLQDTIEAHPNIHWQPYRDLIHSQSRIGWHQVKYGRFSVEWISQQQTYALWRNKGEEDEYKWLRRTIVGIWTFAHHRWSSRCHMKHGGNSMYNATKSDLVHRIKSLYAHSDRLMAQDRSIYTVEVEQWEDKPITVMKQWLKVAQPFIQHCIKIAKHQRHNQAGDIRKFLKNPPTVKHPSKQRHIRQKWRRKNTQHILHQDIRQFIPSYIPPVRDPPPNVAKYAKDPSNSHNTSIPEYFKTQDKPPDRRCSRQKVLSDYFVLIP